MKKYASFESFPEKKDLTYWIIIMTIFLVVVSVWKSDSPESLASELALASTLLSIVLAIMAIIFSFIQSAESSRHNVQMVDKFSEISGSIISLHTISKDLNESTNKQIVKIIEFEALVKEYHKKMNDIENKDENPTASSVEVVAIQNEFIKKAKNTLDSRVNIFGKVSVHNFIKNHFGFQVVYIQQLWSKMYQTNSYVTIEDLTSVLNELEEEGKLRIFEENELQAFKLINLNT